MYKDLEEVKEILNALPDAGLTEEKSLKLYQAFGNAAKNIDREAGNSKNIEDSVALTKILQGLLAASRLTQRIREETR